MRIRISIFIVLLFLGGMAVGVYAQESQKVVLFIEGYGGDTTGISSFEDIGSSNFASALRQEGFLVQSTSATKGIDIGSAQVLVINRPYKAIPQPEINKIKSFVESGGGLFLIGDNKKWNIDPVINPLSSNFGIGFNGNQLAEPIENTKDDVHNLLIKDFSNHAITSGVEVIGYFGGGYLTTTSENIVGSTTKESWIDINDNSRLDGKTEPYNKFIVIAAAEYGQGRVVAIADGTLFENLNYGNYDSNKLAINSIKWLSGDITESADTRGLSLSNVSTVYKYVTLYIILLILITALLAFSVEESKQEISKNIKQFVAAILIGGILGGLIESGNLPYFSALIAGGVGGNLSVKKFTHNSHVLGAIAGGFSTVIGVLIGYLITGKVGFSFIPVNPLTSIGVSLFLGVFSGALFGTGKRSVES